MLSIDQNLVKRMAGSVIYERGLKCAKDNKVTGLELDLKELNGRKTVEINSKVISSTGNKVYDVSINYTEGMNFIDTDCDCKHWVHICKHVVAVLIRFIDNQEEFLKRAEEKKFRGFMNEIKNNFLKKPIALEKTYINTSYKLEISKGHRKETSLEMKIGEDKLYVVKNMKEFLKNFSLEQDMQFGKGFTFYPYLQQFKEEDLKIISNLNVMYEAEKMLEELSDFRSIQSTLFKGKKAYLTESSLNNFFQALENRAIDFIIDGKEFTNVQVEKSDFPLDFQLESKDNSIVLKQNSNIAVPIVNSGKYFFYEGKIYEPSEELVRDYKLFFDEFMKKKKLELSFSHEHSEDIASFIIPTLRKISKNLQVDDRFKDKFYEETLKPQVYFDKKENKVSANVIFKYGNEEINPLISENKKSDRILVRDVEGEKNLTAILQNFHFKKDETCYILENEEHLLDFILKGMESIQETAEAYYSEGFKSIKLHTASSYKSSIKLNKEDLLEFTFNIEGVDKKELRYIFEALKQKKKYYRLKDGGFVNLLNDDINQIGNIIDYLNIKPAQLEKDNIILHKHNAVYLDSLIKDKGITFVERNKSFKELVNNIKDIADIDYVVPKSIEKIMRSYQKFGFKWFKTLASCGFGGILADEMGLGKTLQTIAFIKSEADENKDNKMPCIVICPTSLVYNWQDEISKFQPDLNCVVVSGDKEEREKSIEAVKDADVVVTSYALIRRDIEGYSNIKFRYCFLDEAQNIKNPQSMNAESVKSIKANGYFALTGTPIENSLTELWSIFDFIMPGYLLTQRKFSQKYELPIIKYKDKNALEELNRHIKPFILRRLKKDVIKELPPKIEHNIVVDMTEEQKKVYAAFAEKAKDEMGREIKDKGFNKSKIKILSLITRLRQICCDPSTFIENYDADNGKTEALLNIVDNSISDGHKILIFSQFTSVLKNIAKKFNENNIKHLYLDGSTKADSRGELVKEFNQGDASVFLISLKAGGTGLNLTSADTVIHFDPWWNPAVEQQASDRAHRIGQKKTVEVIRLIAKGSIEEKIYKIQGKKKKIIENVIDENAGEEFLLSNMDENEIEELFG